MEKAFYTLGVWHVAAGREAEFTTAWRDLGVVFTSLANPPIGRGVLVQSTTEPALFYSFGPWQNLEHIAAMRADPRVREAIQKLRSICTESTPGVFRVVAESP